MNKIEIEEKLDRGWVIELMANGYTTYDIASNYELTEDTILDCTDLLDKEILIQGLSFSEDFVSKAIEDKNLWSVISANDLSIDFIRQWKDKLDWSYLSMVKCFTDEEKLEFADYILIPVQKEISEEFINTDDLKFSDKMSEEELEDLIYEISKHIGK